MTHQQPSQSRLGKALKSTVAMVGSCAMLAGMLLLFAAELAGSVLIFRFLRSGRFQRRRSLCMGRPFRRNGKKFL